MGFLNRINKQYIKLQLIMQQVFQLRVDKVDYSGQRGLSGLVRQLQKSI